MCVRQDPCAKKKKDVAVKGVCAPRKARLKAVLRTRKAQQVAVNMFLKLKGKCKEVIEKKGAAIRS